MDFVQFLGQFEPTAAPAPWWLHESQHVCFVDQGAIDIFVVGIRDGKPVGPRRPLYRVFRSMALMPIRRDITGAAEALLVVPLPQTCIRNLSLDEVKRLFDEHGTREHVVSLTSTWIGIMTRGLPLPPLNYRPVRANDPMTMQDGQAFCAVERLLWAKIDRGTAAFMGEADLVVTPDSPPVPLRNDVWFRAVGEVAMSAMESTELVDFDAFWRGVQIYQQLAIRHALRLLDKANDEEALRLRTKAERSSGIMHEALARFVRIVYGDQGNRPDIAADPLFAVCELIGQHLGVAFRVPRRNPLGATGFETVQEIADASAVRTRIVALRGEWWGEDNGPLLVFHAETKAPYALLPVRGRRYELHGPEGREAVRVTRELAQTLNPFATQFYRPFPQRSVKLFDLLEFGAHGQWRDIAVMLLLGMLGGLIGLAIPVATGYMVDTVIPTARRDGAIVLMLVLIATVVAEAIFALVRSVAALRVEGKMDGAVQAAVWDRVLSLPVPFFRKYSAGDLANRINGINHIRSALSGSTIATLLTGVFSLFNFFVLFYYSAKLAGIAVILTLVALLATTGAGLMKLRYERQLADLAGRLSGAVFQYLLGIVKLRVAAAENRAFANWAREFTGLRRIAYKAQRLYAIDRSFFSGYTVIVNAVIFAVLGMILAKESGERLTTGEFVAFSAAFGVFFGGLVKTGETLLGLLNLVPIYERAKPVLFSLPEVSAATKHPGQLQGSIEVVKVAFGYEGSAQVLSDVTFSVRPGGLVALVGPSGSGKSTLFRLLLGFEKPTRGSIYYDNQDISDLDVRELRRQLGVVLQGGQLITGDIFTNIVGASRLTIDDAWAAAKMVGLDEDITRMPMGMHTVVSEGSSTLSGGQRQRIMIARAIVRKPRILFFDEATSALDNRTQAIVSHSLAQLKATRIIIAHRLSTVINADRIIVLKDGAIAQAGAYAELINRPGPFADLAKRQLA